MIEVLAYPIVLLMGTNTRNGFVRVREREREGAIVNPGLGIHICTSISLSNL